MPRRAAVELADDRIVMMGRRSR